MARRGGISRRPAGYGGTSNTAKSSGMPVEVNAAVVQGSIVSLAGPSSPCRLRRFFEEISSSARHSPQGDGGRS